MIDILGETPRICQQIILQPQKSAMELRLWLSAHGYRIDDERLVFDRGRLYTILSIHLESDCASPFDLTLTEAVIGPVLLRQKPPLFADYLNRLASHLRKAVRSNQDLKPVLETVEQLQKTAEAE